MSFQLMPHACLIGLLIFYTRMIFVIFVRPGPCKQQSKSVAANNLFRNANFFFQARHVVSLGFYIINAYGMEKHGSSLINRLKEVNK